MFRLTFALVLITTASAYPAMAGFIQDWTLSVGVIPGNIDGEVSRFRDPVSPFFAEHSVTAAGLESSASYQFWWNANGGTFHANTELEIPAIPGVDRRATARAFIYINSPVPLLISGMSEFEYNLTRDPMRAYLGLGISRLDPPQDIAGELVSYSTAINGPQVGVLNVDFADVLIPPNETYTMLYSFIIDADSGVSGSALATGIGTAHFDVNAIPEPTTACLGVLAAVPLCLRKHRCANRRT
ncbi:MAG TPA: hypothetical protein P5081_09570 [Phycisphaerae bacterium]|nr:hypothetical protein [Phycisphaerae bacterium]HRW53124.1 hypothetical protein [Phycisphaerae bacterium]